MHSISTLPFRSTRASCTLLSTPMAPSKSLPSIRLLSTKASSPSTSKLPHRTSTLHRPTTTFTRSLPKRTYATAAAPRTPNTTTAEPLTWNRFLALRKTRRRISVLSSSLCAVVVLGSGAGAIMASDFDTTASQTLGIDPIAVLGLSSAGLIAVGWLLGPAFGNVIFGLVYRGHRGAIEAKEREFFTRIRKHRVDPSNASLSNPLPDYYGEKIGSVADYRRWLKDQRAYKLKRGRELV